MEVTIPIPQGVETMMRTLVDHGFEAYLVGGCVRDALSGIAPHDYDITTDALPDEIIGIFGEEHCKYYGKAFGTVCVHFGEDEAEITTYRTEGDYTDSRHPGRVDFTKDVMDDLSRRDFTTNAICYSPITGLLDPFGGAEDLQKGILRAVGVPSDRFREDALRIMRGMRFYARFEAGAGDRCRHACGCTGSGQYFGRAHFHGAVRHAAGGAHYAGAHGLSRYSVGADPGGRAVCGIRAAYAPS